MDVTFEPVAENDIAEVAAMMADFNNIFGYPVNLEERRNNLLCFISNPALGNAWTIQNNETIIGYIILSFGFSFERNGRIAFIDELYIRSDFRQKGIGNLAMSFIHDQARMLGVKAILLEAEPDNLGAVKLYKEKGFNDLGRLLMLKNCE